MKVITRASGVVYSWRRRIATVSVVVLACMVGFHVIFGANGMLIYQKKRAENKALEHEIKQLQEEQERLNQRIRALRTDPKAIEKEAREQLRYARPGEIVYSTPVEQNPQAATSTARK